MISKFISPFLLILALFLFAACRNTGDVKIIDHKAPLFELVSPEASNIKFQNNLTEALNTNILMYEYFYNGGGVAAADFNNDGLVDLYFTANMSENKFYLNKGKLQFEDITLTSGAAGRPGPWKSGVSAVDINADGKMDLYICYSGALPQEKRANQLFINQGNDAQGIPTFKESAAEYGLESTGFSNQSYFLDYDRDGDLDMLLLNHNPKNLPILNELSTAQMFAADSPEKGLRLFQQTNGKFEDVTIKSGINGSELSYGLGLGISDFNSDGWPDFYVSNDYAVPDFYYINNKDGSFTNQLQNSMGHTSQFSMGNDVADINNDNRTDILTLDMLPEDNHRQKLLLTPDNYDKFNLNVRSGFYYQYMRNMLQLNNGNGTFSETGQQAGISNTDWSWSALLADYDNDGWKDLFVTNGYLRDYTNLDFINYMNEYVQKKGRLQRDDVMEIIKQMPSSNVVNYIFRNKQDGSFENQQQAWGINQPSNSNGAVYADLDNDGDLDLVVNNINQPAFIYKNESRTAAKNNFLTIQLIGEAGNTQGLGAKLQLYQAGHLQTLEQNPSRGYLSSVSFALHFGLGSATRADSLLIRWNSGKMQKLENVSSNQVLKLEEKNASGNFIPEKLPAPWFEETTNGIRSSKIDSTVNDFNRQTLLISQFSYHGPCITKADLNKDGLEDMVIGGTPGFATSIYLQQKNASFSGKPVPAFDADKAFDDGAIAVLDANMDGLPDIYIASGGYFELTATDPLLQDRLYLNNGHGNFTRSELPPVIGSKSSVTLIDINDDKAPDLFVGGRVVPGRYPEPPRSYLLVNDGKGKFTDQTSSIAPELVQIGMVTDAVWVDLNLDQKNELVVVGEWMPVSIFTTQDGKLVNKTEQFLGKNFTGWWNTVAVADLNGDQKPDLIVGNAGFNAQFKASEQEPMDLYYKDFDLNGSVDPIFSFNIQGKEYPFLTRDELVAQLPLTRKRFSSYKNYADIGLTDLFPPEELKTASHLSASFMGTTAFISSASGKLNPLTLPAEVQYSPIYTINTLDFNGDGNTDLLFCGNNSHTKIRLGKFDANFGVLVAGDGKGGFRYIPQRESGLKIWGDVRSSVQIKDKLFFGRINKPIVSFTLRRK